MTLLSIRFLKRKKRMWRVNSMNGTANTFSNQRKRSHLHKCNCSLSWHSWNKCILLSLPQPLSPSLSFSLPWSLSRPTSLKLSPSSTPTQVYFCMTNPFLTHCQRKWRQPNVCPSNTRTGKTFNKKSSNATALKCHRCVRVLEVRKMLLAWLQFWASVWCWLTFDGNVCLLCEGRFTPRSGKAADNDVAQFRRRANLRQVIRGRNT